MRLKNRKQLAKLMAIQGVSARSLARVAGWRSHSYMNRLLSGQASTLETDPALRIAHYLGVDVDLLFETRVAGDSGRAKNREYVA